MVYASLVCGRPAAFSRSFGLERTINCASWYVGWTESGMQLDTPHPARTHLAGCGGASFKLKKTSSSGHTFRCQMFWVTEGLT